MRIISVSIHFLKMLSLNVKSLSFTFDIFSKTLNDKGHSLSYLRRFVFESSCFKCLEITFFSKASL